jgi:hypothetical protein
MHMVVVVVDQQAIAATQVIGVVLAVVVPEVMVSHQLVVMEAKVVNTICQLVVVVEHIVAEVVAGVVVVDIPVLDMVLVDRVVAETGVVPITIT